MWLALYINDIIKSDLTLQCGCWSGTGLDFMRKVRLEATLECLMKCQSYKSIGCWTRCTYGEGRGHDPRSIKLLICQIIWFYQPTRMFYNSQPLLPSKMLKRCEKSFKLANCEWAINRWASSRWKPNYFRLDDLPVKSWC